nr:PREDICTED: chemokine XC receptor 1-like [Austrofundulus limnaeus]
MEYYNKLADDGGDDSDGDRFTGYCDIYDFANINGYLFILITIISVIGNALLIFLLVTQKDLNFITKTFILNLACADLIFTASLPFWAYYHLHHWVFGDFLCKFMTGVYFVGLYSSIFILTAMTVDRFVTVVRNRWPNKSVRRKCAVGACVAAWLISLMTSGYDTSKIEVENDYYYTMEYSNKSTDAGGDDTDEAIFICHFVDFTTISGYSFILFTIIGVIGNALLIFLLVTQKDQTFVPKFLILNLACADLIFTASLPFWAYYHLHHWVFGDFLCKFMTAVYFVGMYSSIFILTALTADRFVTVVLNRWPNKSVRRKCGVGACVAAWLISVVVSVYDASKMELEEDSCEDFSEVELGYYFQVSFIFLLPFLIIVFCHCSIMTKVFQATNRQRHKATSIVFCVLAAYVVCWGPYNFLLFIKSLTNQPDKCKAAVRLDVAYNVCRILAFSHCCVNPLLCLLSQKLRSRLLSLLTDETLCLKNRSRLTEQNVSGVQTIRLSVAQTSADILELQPQ